MIVQLERKLSYMSGLPAMFHRCLCGFSQGVLVSFQSKRLADSVYGSILSKFLIGVNGCSCLLALRDPVP